MPHSPRIEDSPEDSDVALQLLDDDDSDGVALRLPVRFVGAVVDGLTRAAQRLGAVVQRVDLRRGGERVDAKLRFVDAGERRLSITQRHALMAAALEVIDTVITPPPASRPSWLPG